MTSRDGESETTVVHEVEATEIKQMYKSEGTTIDTESEYVKFH